MTTGQTIATAFTCAVAMGPAIVGAIIAWRHGPHDHR